MASIIEGYENDIFISYRQKDNKYDGWVTDFVDNLKRELEATFKEEISVYFDINPHDGLLETHDVDASLKKKLMSLVFIPIISRTYCDPKSFAWEHELKAFVENAARDQFGLKVVLPNGNVANRILPVRIHALDQADIKLCESITGGVLRGVDFIYKSPGVNRPLRANEDHPHDNLNKTYYRDQINKVANAIKDVIYCLNPGSAEFIGQPEQPGAELHDSEKPVTDQYTGNFEDTDSFELIQKRLVSGKRTIAALSVLIVLSGIFGLWGWLRPGSGLKNIPTYSAIPVESTLMDAGGQYPLFAISPDGMTIAYVAEKGIQLQSLSGFSTKLLEGTEKSTHIGFSPDGQSMAYSKDGHIYRIGITGSPVSLIFSEAAGPGLSWGIDDYIYFSPGLGSEGIWRVSASGGEARQITSVLDSLGETAHTWPQLLPDSHTLLFTALGPSGGSADSRIVIQQINSDIRETLVRKATNGIYLSNGKILYSTNEGNLFTLAFDLRRLRIRGEPETVLSGVNTSTWSGGAFISVSENGNMVFLPRNSGILNVLDVADRTGKIIDKDSIPSKTFEKMGHGWFNVSISPSGSYLACTGRSFGSFDIWLLNLETGEPERITFNYLENEFPVWSPDGNSIAYTSSMTGATRGMNILDRRNGRNPQLIGTWPRHLHFTSWSPDGKWLAAHDFTPTNGTDCYTISVDSGKFIKIAASKANESSGQFSPDGRWIAFQSDESGRFEIYVASFPDLSDKRQISFDGGTAPQWDPGGKTLYYLAGDYIISQPVECGNNFIRGKPVKMFPAKALNYGLSPDGRKFYLYRRNLKRPNPPLQLITNWFQKLKTNKS